MLEQAADGDRPARLPVLTPDATRGDRIPPKEAPMTPTRRTFLAGLSVMAVAPALVRVRLRRARRAPATPAAEASGAEETRLPGDDHSTSTARPTVEKAPTRVVCVGLTEQDALLALGIVPVAVTKWFGEAPGFIFPWATDALGDAELPEVLDVDQRHRDREGRGARARPDHRPVRRDHREGVRAAVQDRPHGRAVRRLRRLRHAVGRDGAATSAPRSASPRRCRASSTTSRTQIAQAAADHPEFEGKTAAVITPYEGLFVYGPEDPRSRMLVDLGFTFPEILAERRRRVRRLDQLRAHRRPRRGRRRGLARPRGRPGGQERSSRRPRRSRRAAGSTSATPTAPTTWRTAS